MDERAMPRATDAPGRELDVARIGARPLRKRQTSWKQPLAEARCEPLKSVAARLAQLDGDENALWLTVNESPDCTPLDDMGFSTDAQVRLDLPVVQGGLYQHQRRQKYQTAQQGPSAWPAHLDGHGQHAQKCLIGGDRAKLHDVCCHIIHNACCQAGLQSQREAIGPTMATENLTEPRFDADAPRAAAHSTRLHSRRRGRSSLLVSDAKRTRRSKGCDRRSELKKTNMGKRKEELESLASLCSSSHDLAQG